MSEAIPKIREIADRIHAHLRRIEHAQPNRGSATSGYWMASAWEAGPRVGIKYVSYQYAWKLKKADAWRYLQWLDAGNEGRHVIALGDIP